MDIARPKNSPVRLDISPFCAKFQHFEASKDSTFVFLLARAPKKTNIFAPLTLAMGQSQKEMGIFQKM